MNRRMRKKNRCGEYLELGFSIGIYFCPECEYDAMDKFGDYFMDLLEANEMRFGGGTNLVKKTFGMYVTSERSRGKSKRLHLSVTPEQRQLVIDWCKARPEVYKLKVGEFSNVWRKVPQKEWDMTFEEEMEGAEVIRELKRAPE